MAQARAIKIAITALGGQGGGVLASWIVRLGERCGYIVQSTSVPGVAQRTGATVYYVELFPEAEARDRTPVLALMPAPGDVDIVIAAEMMEAGRAIARGFVSRQTTLIASSHRDFAIGEKIAMGDGRQSPDVVLRAAQKAAGRFIHADMAEAGAGAGAVISAVLFGALAGSGALPMARDAFEETIRESRRAVKNNLKGFARGFDLALAAADAVQPAPPAESSPTPTPESPPAPAVAPLLERLERDFPSASHVTLKEGLRRCVDYQDVKYAQRYLDRLESVEAADRAAEDYRLTTSVGKYLALWMTYEDSIRVADLKTRASRLARCREDVRAEEDQIVHIADYLHPRVEEVCDLLPKGLAMTILGTPILRKMLGAVLGGGRRLPTSKLRGFLLLRLVASLRVMRRATYRFGVEQARIDEWLSAVKSEAAGDYALACEIAALPRLIKGYGETHERGLGNFSAVMAALGRVRAQADPVKTLAALRDAALADEEGAALKAAIARLDDRASAAA